MLYFLYQKPDMAMLAEARLFHSSLSPLFHCQTAARSLQEKTQKLQQGVGSKNGIVLGQEHGAARYEPAIAFRSFAVIIVCHRHIWDQLVNEGQQVQCVIWDVCQRALWLPCKLGKMKVYDLRHIIVHSREVGSIDLHSKTLVLPRSYTLRHGI